MPLLQVMDSYAVDGAPLDIPLILKHLSLDFLLTSMFGADVDALKARSLGGARLPPRASFHNPGGTFVPSPSALVLAEDSGAGFLSAAPLHISAAHPPGSDILTAPPPADLSGPGARRPRPDQGGAHRPLLLRHPRGAAPPPGGRPGFA